MSRGVALALIAAVVLLGIALLLERTPASLAPSDGSAIVTDRFNPANEGRLVIVSGDLRAAKSPSDPVLGLVADGQLMLLREVQMYQWQEYCESRACRYEGIWAAQHIDSTPFQTHTGHANPEFPFGSASLFGDGIRLGDFDVASGLIATAVKPVAWPVDAQHLPPNLAASFDVVDGELFSGSAEAPKIGDLHIRYRALPQGNATITGIQRGSRLEPPARKD